MLKRFIYSLFLVGTIGLVQGQTSFELEQTELRELNLKGDNAAFLQKSTFKDLGNSALYYQRTTGAFKHPFVAKERDAFGFESERYQNLKDWKIYGRFGLGLISDQQVNNTTQLNPLRINPFIVVDSLSGDWSKQNYAIETKVASPLVGQWGFGLGLKYNVQTGARQRDPRPLNTSNTLELQPAVSFALHESSSLGLSGTYRLFVEDFSVSNINPNTIHNMYKLIGVGEYVGSMPLFISAGGITRRYEGKLYGGGFQYSYSKDGLKLLGETFLNINNEQAIDGTVNPQNAGKHHFIQYGLNLVALYNSKTFLHKFSFSWDQKDIDNTEYHQYLDATSRQYVTLFSNVFNTNLMTQASLAYTLAKQSESSWQFGTHVDYSGLDNRYAANQSQQMVDRLSYGIRVKKYLAFRNSAGLSIHFEPLYSHTLDQKFTYDEKSYATNFVAHQILYPTNAYLSSNYWHLGAAVQYNFMKANEKNTQFYIKLSQGSTLPIQSNNYFNTQQHRFSGQLALGVLSF